jgi:cob(I)alamin adenosyltransferase
MGTLGAATQGMQMAPSFKTAGLVNIRDMLMPVLHQYMVKHPDLHLDIYIDHVSDHLFILAAYEASKYRSVLISRHEWECKNWIDTVEDRLEKAVNAVMPQLSAAAAEYDEVMAAQDAMDQLMP